MKHIVIKLGKKTTVSKWDVLQLTKHKKYFTYKKGNRRYYEFR